LAAAQTAAKLPHCLEFLSRTLVSSPAETSILKRSASSLRGPGPAACGDGCRAAEGSQPQLQERAEDLARQSRARQLPHGGGQGIVIDWERAT
jgi:hypothetical protein